MLVLTRTSNKGDFSQIILTDSRTGHEIVVTVSDVRGDQVRLGIQAPREVAIHRAEIYQRKTASPQL